MGQIVHARKDDQTLRLPISAPQIAAATPAFWIPAFADMTDGGSDDEIRETEDGMRG